MILKEKFSKALIDSGLQWSLIPTPAIEVLGSISLMDWLIWARKNHVDAIIHLESIIELSHVYRTHDLPSRYYPKIWTKAKIIRLQDNKLLWSKRVWTHLWDRTGRGLTRSPYGTVFDKEDLEPLIYRKIDFVVNALIKDLLRK